MISTPATRCPEATAGEGCPIDWVNALSPAHRIGLLGLAKAKAEQTPDDPVLQVILCRALVDTGQVDQAAIRLREARVRFPTDASLAAALARTLGRNGEVDEALSVTRDWKNEAWAARLSLGLLTKHHRFDEAASYEDQVAAVDPADHALIECRARRLRSRPEAMLQLCDAALAMDPGATHAIFYKSIALAQLGRAEESAELMGLDRFVAIERLPVPPAFTGMPEFLAVVREEILANPSLRPDIMGHATRKGLRTLHFPVAGDIASSALVHSIESVVADYADALAGSHPFVAARPERASLVAWALVFREAGHQVVHCHPGRWMTGVCYVSSPGGSPRPGAIRIGVFPDWAGVSPPWPVQTIEPEPGRLILFPSFVPHDTVPTGSAEERISIAFDIAASA